MDEFSVPQDVRADWNRARYGTAESDAEAPRPATDQARMADIHIQWKGTDVCLDFHCSCTTEDAKYMAHYDGYFAYAIECPNCGAIYDLPSGFTLRSRQMVTADPVKPEKMS